MMKKMKRMKLKSQLNFIVLLVATSVITLMVLFFIGFELVTFNRAEVYFTNICEQLESQMSYMVKNVERSSKTVIRSKAVKEYLVEENMVEKNKLYPYVSNQLNNEIVLNNYIWDVERYIQHISIIDRSNETINFYIEDLSNIKNQMLENYFANELIDGGPVFTDPYYWEEKQTSYYGYIQPIFSSISQSMSKRRIGTSIHICATDVLQQVIESMSISEQSVFMLADSSQRIFAANDHTRIGKTLEDNQIDIDFLIDKDVMTFNNEKHFIKVMTIQETDWNMIFMVPLSELSKDMKPMQNAGIIIGVGITFVLLIACSFVAKNINGQMVKVVDGMRHIGKRSPKYRLELVGENEIATLAKSINVMLDQIEDMNNSIVSTQEQLYTAEIEKRQATINALQSQINPHFLYNTLECIRSIASCYGIEEIEKITVSMADIFRYCIKEEDIVTINEEIQSIKNYFEIISIRHRGRFILNLNLKDEILNKNIIKMVLQPIIENSVYHGLEKRNGPGEVSITGFCKDERIIISIKDNGVGISETKLEELYKTIQNPDGISLGSNGSIGLRNIYKRLKLTYGEAYGLTIISSQKRGTEIKITIPASN